MSRTSEFSSTLAALWFRLVSLAVVGLVFAEALSLAAGEAQGWSFFIPGPEVAFEVLVYLIATAVAGVVLGTVCTCAMAPFLWHFEASRERLSDITVRVAVVLVLFLNTRGAVSTLIAWSGHFWGWHRTAILTAHFVIFVIVLCLPRERKELTSTLDDLLEEKTTRRVALATGIGAVALVATEFGLSKTVPTVKAALVSQRPKANILLITFDALCAEDMSLYGYRLPTTPNLDAFAERGTVFTNYYSGSTFTTPSFATMLTGKYPSDTRVFQLHGRLSAADVEKSLPHAMRAAGYRTGAFFSNPNAYSLATSLGSEFDSSPEPIFEAGGMESLWNFTRPLHQMSRVGSRIDEYLDLANLWNSLSGLPRETPVLRMPAATTFEHARNAIDQMPEGFFYWAHAISPHTPYLPDAVDKGRFLPPNQSIASDETFGEERMKPYYSPDQQNIVDRRRLRYDEFIATADRAFGAFISKLESDGKLQNTTVIVSADHGESFSGGVYQHWSPLITRPVIHIPLIIRTPGQQDGRRVALTVDQTALAPTILELAGQPKPDGMQGQSLVEWLQRDGQGEGEGMAFCQCLDRNSAFKPLHHGAIGVIEGQTQYVLDLDTLKGYLRPLPEAHIWNLDRSAEYPALAESLRAALYARFPDLPRKA